jgi:hypothetical protein
MSYSGGMPLPLPNSPLLIAEAKHESPFDGQLSQSFKAMFELADTYGDIVSILVDPRWGGSLDDLAWARSQTVRPLLAKGMHINDTQIEDAFGAGADYVLAYDYVPYINPHRCLVEPRNIGRFALLDPNQLAVWNARDLSNGERKDELPEEANVARNGEWWCQASFMRSLGDIHPGAGAAIVGTHLAEFVVPLEPTPLLSADLWP